MMEPLPLSNVGNEISRSKQEKPPFFAGRARLLGAIAACALAGGFPLQAGPGDLDPTFGSGGKVAFSIAGSNGNDYGKGLAIQDDGKIVTIGQSYSGPRLSLARHNADGSIDTTFGNSGTVYGAFGAIQDYGYAVAVQADGKIVAVGSVTTSGESEFLIVRYNTDGTLDTTFNSTGFATFDFAGYDRAQAVLIQPSDQKIVVAGRADNASVDFGLLRYNTDGSLDTSFGSSGSVATDFGSNSDTLRALAILSDGKILAAGQTNDMGVNQIAVARYNADGSLDTTFDTDGKVTTLAGTDSLGYSVHGLEMGKILVTGQAEDGDDDVFTLIRYNSDGSLDTTFNSTGIVLGPVGSEGYSAIQENGRIVVAGTYYKEDEDSSDFAVARFFPNGSLDTNFGSGGRALVDFAGSAEDDYGSGVAIQSDGKIVVVGQTYDGSQDDFALARLDSLDLPPPHILKPDPRIIQIFIATKKVKKLKKKLRKIKNKASRSKVKKLKKKLKKKKKKLKRLKRAR